MGAAPTGSGKTLSYGLPILQRLLEERDDDEGEGGRGGGDEKADEMQDEDGGEEAGVEVEGGSRGHLRRRVLRALILTPTRELAMQVASELTRVCHGGDLSSASRTRTIGIGTIVGGFAEAKQRRILEKDRPAVLVATPGRLWEMVSRSEETRKRRNKTIKIH